METVNQLSVLSFMISCNAMQMSIPRVCILFGIVVAVPTNFYTPD
jgi:hypothetical protein